MKTFVLLMMWLGGSVLFAQNVNPLSWDEFVEQTFDFSTDDDSEVENENTLLFEELQFIHDHPIDINSATKEDLASLPFLDDTQIEEIVEYVKKHPMSSLGELMVLNSMDVQTRMKLMLFCYAGVRNVDGEGKKDLKKLLKYSNHELTLRADIPFYTKAGYDESITPKEKMYRGDRIYRSLRYNLSSGKVLDAGLRVEKDAGEKDFDYLSAYVRLKQLGKVSSLIVGDYKVSYGMGLVVNNSVNMGKIMSLSSLQGNDKGIYGNTSMTEVNYFRGLAAKMDISRQMDLSVFVSYVPVDATLDADDDDKISSLKKDGMHRTNLEKSKKGNVNEFSFGGNLRWQPWNGNVRLGVSGIYSSLSKSLAPKCDTESSLYRYYYPQGSCFYSLGTSYAYYGRLFQLNGETAINRNDALATVNVLRCNLSNSNSLTCIYRYYSARYANIHAQAFGENSSPQNESGIYVGWKSDLTSKLKVNLFFDYFYFPYRKYQVSDSSNGFDGMAQVSYANSKVSNWNIRYRIKSKQKDCKYVVDDEEMSELGYYTNQSFRVQNNFCLGENLVFRTSAFITDAFSPLDGNELGWAATEYAEWKSLSKGIKIGTYLAYFDTRGYSSRIYSYEPGLLYSFGMGSLYNNGMKISLLLTTQISKLSLSMKYGFTGFFDGDGFGTGLERCGDSGRTDLAVLLRLAL